LKEFLSYCQAVKDVLKLRDQKQIDQEVLENWLQTHESDRDRTMSTGKSVGITGFFKDKINDFKGVDPEKTRVDRLVKLETKITEVWWVNVAPAGSDSEQGDEPFVLVRSVKGD
jgi:sorting nexin-4